MFYAGPNILGQSKNGSAFCASSIKYFVPVQKPNSLNGNHLLKWLKIFGALYSYEFLVWPNIFWPVKNILEPVQGEATLTIIFNMLVSRPEILVHLF